MNLFKLKAKHELKTTNFHNHTLQNRVQVNKNIRSEKRLFPMMKDSSHADLTTS